LKSLQEKLTLLEENLEYYRDENQKIKSKFKAEKSLHINSDSDGMSNVKSELLQLIEQLVDTKLENIHKQAPQKQQQQTLQTQQQQKQQKQQEKTDNGMQTTLILTDSMARSIRYNDLKIKRRNISYN
jgi:hypothetical protein